MAFNTFKSNIFSKEMAMVVSILSILSLVFTSIYLTDNNDEKVFAQDTISSVNNSNSGNSQNNITMTNQQQQQSADQQLPSQNQLALTTIFKNVQNSVVQITSKIVNPNINIIINGNPLQSQSERLGSGFVYDKQGHIITNSHVVGGTKTVDVTFVDGNTYTAKVVGFDHDSDVAVLQLTDNFSQENIAPLPIGNSYNLQVGQQIVAIGNPYGLDDTMTTGIISQIGRTLQDPNSMYSIPNTIQIDAAINPGNSGGPLLNMQGQVVGMNTAIYTGTGSFSGVGFAIPSNMVVKVATQLIKTGAYKHPWLGVVGTSLTPETSQALGLSKNFKGILVTTVVTGSPADKSGLKGGSVQEDQFGNQRIIGGDIITAIDGHSVKRMDDLLSYIDGQKTVGDSTKMTTHRNGKTMDLTTTLTARPATNNQQNYPQEQQQNPDNGNNIFPNIPGFKFQNPFNFP